MWYVYQQWQSGLATGFVKDSYMEQLHRISEVGFGRLKPGEGRAGESAAATSPSRAEDASRVALTREALDAARYISEMTAPLEAAAIGAHLDRLAYFLQMAKLESEISIRTYFGSEAERVKEIQSLNFDEGGAKQCPMTM